MEARWRDHHDEGRTMKTDRRSRIIITVEYAHPDGSASGVTADVIYAHDTISAIAEFEESRSGLNVFEGRAVVYAVARVEGEMRADQVRARWTPFDGWRWVAGVDAVMETP